MIIARPPSIPKFLYMASFFALSSSAFVPGVSID